MDFLARVETMPIGSRTRFLAAYALEHAGEDAFAALLAELAGRDAFAAELSLFAARVAGDREHVGSLLAHEDCDIATAAVKAAAALGGLDGAVESAVLDGAPHVRRAAYRALRVRVREALADRLLPRVRERFGEREAARLLPGCGDAAVAEALPEMAYALTSWATLARRHPSVFAAYAEQSLAALPSPQWAQWWVHHWDGVAPAVEAEPALWLPLLDRFWVESMSAVVGPLLPRLITADPDAAWRFVLAPEHAALLRSVCRRRNVLRRLADRDTATVAAFVRACPGGGLAAQTAVLTALAPSRRAAVVAACERGRPDALANRQVSCLPKRLRRERVRRLLARRAVAEDRAAREDLRSCLPFKEVREELIAATARSSAAERATAYEHLIRCAGLDGPKAVAAMLGALHRRLARDQDPVHAAALTALRKVPAHQWRESHLAALDDLIGAILASPWRSGATDRELLRLASRLLLAGMSHGRPAFTEFGCAALERVAAECDGGDLAPVLRLLPRRVAAELCRRLMPVVSGQAEVGRFGPALVFARALGRADAPPELYALLRKAARSADARSAREAVSALVSADPDAVVELVESDASAAVAPAVLMRLIRDRVDVLAAWLAAPGDDVSALLPPLSRGVTRRWPPAVREACLAALAAVVRDGRRGAHERAMAVRAMSRVAGVGIADLQEPLEGGSPALSKAALAAVDAAGPPERAWELLMERAAGPDAAVAGLGLVRLSRRMRPAFLAERIAPMLESERVAARKQGVRLVLAHRLPGAEAAVRELWDDASQPDGVREAIVAGLVHWLDRPWSGRIVRESVHFGADVAAPALSPAPFEVAPRHREAYAGLLAEAAGSGDERLTEAALAGIGRWAPYSAHVREALVALVSNLDSTANWNAGAVVLCDLAAADDWGPLLEAVRRLRSNGRLEPNATAERDSPVRQRLERLVSLLSGEHRGTTVDAVPDALIELLPVDLGTRLLFAAAPWEADAARLRRIAGRIADPLEAYQLGRRLRLRLHAVPGADFLPFFERLASSGLPNACVLAAAAIGTPGAEAGWTSEWRELLRRLRDYPASEVSRLACGVYTARE